MVIIAPMQTSDRSQISDSSRMYPRPSKLEMVAIGGKRYSPFLLKSWAQWLLLALQGLPDSGPRSFLSEVLFWVCFLPSALPEHVVHWKHFQCWRPQTQNVVPIRERQSSDSRATAVSRWLILLVLLWFSGSSGSSPPGPASGLVTAVFGVWTVTAMPGVGLTTTSLSEDSSKLYTAIVRLYVLPFICSTESQAYKPASASVTFRTRRPPL